MVPCADHARYHHFTHDIVLLDVPDETKIAIQRSASVVQNMNAMVEEMLAGDSAWAWIIGDDHCFPRDIVVSLLAHDVDIVVPLCTRRSPPFGLVAFTEPQEGEEKVDPLGRPFWHIIQFDELPKHGLMEIHAAGTAGMLVKREVFERMEGPWFENSDTISTNEDVTFCRKARDLGFKVMLDVDSRIGHIGNFAAWPDRRGGDWGLTLDFQGQGQNHIFLAGGIRSRDNGTPDTRTGTLDWQ